MCAACSPLATRLDSYLRTASSAPGIRRVNATNANDKAWRWAHCHSRLELFYTHAEWIFPSALPWHSPRRVDFFSLAYFIVVVVVDVVLPRQIWILWLPSVCRQARRKKSEFHLPSHIKKENVSLEYLQRTSRLTRRRDDNELAPPKYFIFFMRCLAHEGLMKLSSLLLPHIDYGLASEETAK